jgi:hypothetical protein
MKAETNRGDEACASEAGRYLAEAGVSAEANTMCCMQTKAEAGG